MSGCLQTSHSKIAAQLLRVAEVSAGLLATPHGTPATKSKEFECRPELFIQREQNAGQARQGPPFWR
jgi:hypothetical protein